MALITISGDPGCRSDEVARIASQHLHFELITQARLDAMLIEEFGADMPHKAHRYAVASVAAHLATEHHLIVNAEGAELAFQNLPSLLNVRVIAPDSRRVGTLMVDSRLERSAARELLGQLDGEQKALRRKRYGRTLARPQDFDLLLNADSMETEQMAAVIGATARSMALGENGVLSTGAEAQLQFRVRLELSKHGILPSGRAKLKRVAFGHPSEETFANMLDFYRIAWEYEPRSFPVQWTHDGKVLEAFTPDFYLPEFNLYVELTTMKQAHVTKKNRKIKLLREIYPEVNIQVFYQKDLQHLIFKWGVGVERPVVQA